MLNFLFLSVENLRKFIFVRHKSARKHYLKQDMLVRLENLLLNIALYFPTQMNIYKNTKKYQMSEVFAKNKRVIILYLSLQ